VHVVISDIPFVEKFGELSIYTEGNEGKTKKYLDTENFSELIIIRRIRLGFLPLKFFLKYNYKFL